VARRTYCGIGLAWREGGEIRSLYNPMRHPDTDDFDPDRVYRWLKDLVASGVRVVTQNGLYDWGWLRTDGGIVMPNVDRLEEIGALATLIDENQFANSLEALCARYGLPGKDAALLKKAVEAAGFPLKRAKEYICQLPARLVVYALAAEEFERAGDDRAKAVTALTHRLLADETLRQALVEPIIRNIAAGSIATVVHHRRGAK
jgi:hypothetical protein